MGLKTALQCLKVELQDSRVWVSQFPGSCSTSGLEGLGLIRATTREGSGFEGFRASGV